MIEYGLVTLAFAAGLGLGVFIGACTVALLVAGGRKAPTPMAQPAALLPDVNVRPLGTSMSDYAANGRLRTVERIRRDE